MCRVRCELSSHYPNTTAIASHLASGNPAVQQQLTLYCTNCVKVNIFKINLVMSLLLI